MDTTTNQKSKDSGLKVEVISKSDVFRFHLNASEAGVLGIDMEISGSMHTPDSKVRINHNWDEITYLVLQSVSGLHPHEIGDFRIKVMFSDMTIRECTSMLEVYQIYHNTPNKRKKVEITIIEAEDE